MWNSRNCKVLLEFSFRDVMVPTEYLIEKEGFLILTKPTDSKQEHDILIFNSNKYYFNSKTDKTIYWRCSAYKETKCTQRLQTDIDMQKFKCNSMFYQQHVDDLKKLQHQHNPTWTKPIELRTWTTRKLYEMVKSNDDSVKESYRKFNIYYPVFAVRSIPKFTTIQRKLYEATTESRPKLPKDCKGLSSKH